MTPDRAPMSWPETRRRLARDLARLRSLIAGQLGAAPTLLWLHPAAVCVALFRLSHYFWDRGHRKSARLAFHLNALLTGGELHPQNDIGGGLLIPHPTGCALMCSAGDNLTVMSRSGSGMAPKMRDVGAGPGVGILGNDCTLGPSCGIQGPWRIGDRVHIVTGIPVMRDVPDDCVVESLRPPVIGAAPQARKGRTRAVLPCRHDRVRDTLRDLRDDLDAHHAQARGQTMPATCRQRASALFTTQMFTLSLYRLSHMLHARGHVHAAARIARLNQRLNRATINPASCVRGGWFLPTSVGRHFQWPRREEPDPVCLFGRRIRGTRARRCR